MLLNFFLITIKSAKNIRLYPSHISILQYLMCDCDKYVLRLNVGNIWFYLFDFIFLKLKLYEFYDTA